ncbi:MAG: hypothetical protein IH950_15075 [Bacteroidetes bacterium]|nr:hypothetical protein [Bacteroidota bacterium]
MSEELEKQLKAIASSFDKQIKELEEKADNLKEDRQTIYDMLDKQSGVPSANSNLIVHHSALRPIDAITDLMRKNTQERWTPTDLRDSLQQLQKEGKLISKASNLLWVVHSSLKSLVKRDDITKEMGKDGTPVYKLTEKENGRLL